MRRAFAAIVFLGACAQTPPATQPPPGEDTCGGERFSHLVGADAATIDRASLPAGARVITPDMMVTMDYAEGRLNVMVGADGKVGSLRCF